MEKYLIGKPLGYVFSVFCIFCGSGDYIGQEFVLDGYDLVFEM